MFWNGFFNTLYFGREVFVHYFWQLFLWFNGLLSFYELKFIKFFVTIFALMFFENLVTARATEWFFIFTRFFMSFLISSALAYFYVDIADLDLHARSEIGNKKIERFVYNPKESLSRLLPSFLLPSELLVPHFVFHIEDLNFVVAKIGLIHLLV